MAAERDQTALSLGDDNDASSKLQAAEEHLDCDFSMTALNLANEATELYRKDKNDNGRALALLAFVQANLQMDIVDTAETAAQQEQDVFINQGKNTETAIMTLAKGDIHLYRGHISDAMQLLEEAAEKFKQEKEKKLEGRALLKQAEGQMLRAAYKEARAAANQAKDLFKEEGEAKLQGKAALMIGDAYLQERDAKNAMQSAKEARSFFKPLKSNRLLEGKSLHLMAQAHLQMDVPYMAQRLADEAWNIFQKAGFARGLASVLHTSVRIWIRKDPDGSVSVALEGLNEVKLASDAQGSIDARSPEVAAMDALIEAHIAAGNTEEALIAAKNQVGLYEEIGKSHRAAKQMLVLTRLYASLKKKDLAIRCANDAHGILEDIGDTKGCAQAQFEMAEVHFQNSEDESARDKCLMARSLYQSIEDRRGEIASLMRLSRIQHRLEDESAALGSLSEVQQLAQDCGDTRAETRAVLMWAQDLLMRGALEEAVNKAREAQDRAREVTKECGDKALEAAASHLMASIYLDSASAPQEAQRAAEEARKMYKAIRNKSAEAAVTRMAAEANIELLQEEVSKNAGQQLGPDGQAEHEKLLRFHFRNALKDAESAVDLAREAVSNAKDDRQYQACLHTLGQCLHTLAQVFQLDRNAANNQKALDKCNEAIDVFSECKDRIAESVVRLLRAHCHFHLGKVQDAKTDVTNALNAFQEANHAEAAQAAENLRQDIMGDGARGGGAYTAGGVAGQLAISTGAAKPYSGPSLEDVIATVSDMSKDLLASDELTPDEPLMDAGLDSLATVQLRTDLQNKFPTIDVPSTIIFDFPNINSLSGHLVESMRAAFHENAVQG